jgi:hypothetical protein
MATFVIGGYEWSGNPAVFCPDETGQKAPEEMLLLDQAHDLYTPEEHIRAEGVVDIISDLYYIAARGYPAEDFNADKMYTPEECEEALRLLGLNPSEPFTVKGQVPIRGDNIHKYERTFIYESGTLKDVGEVNFRELDPADYWDNTEDHRRYSLVLESLLKDGFISKDNLSKIDEFKEVLKDYIKTVLKGFKKTNNNDDEEGLKRIEKFLEKMEADLKRVAPKDSKEAVIPVHLVYSRPEKLMKNNFIDVYA